MRGSKRVEMVKRWFGVEGRRSGWRGGGEEVVLPKVGEIVLITGASGAGKSTLLRRCRARIPGRWRVDLDRLRIPEKTLAELFEDVPLEEGLQMLSRVGLGEAHSYLLRPRELSDGQRWRLGLAIAVHRARVLAEAEKRRGSGVRGEGAGGRGVCIVADEFGGILDRVTALIVARALRRAVDENEGLCAMVASCREDLVEALRPSRVMKCDFGRCEVGREDE
ncbi:MAG: ATP-binding cassette domain-containing protein [Bacillota bacterium]